MFRLLPKKGDFYKDAFLQNFAKAGNVKVLSTMLVQAMVTNHNVDEEKKEENTFLHTLAEKHDIKTLKNLFQGINRKEIEDKRKIGYKKEREDKKKEASTSNWITTCIDMQNEKGYTFLAVAVNKTEKETETDMIIVLKWMIDTFTENFISELCKKKDKGGNNLIHLAVRKSLTELTSFILSKTTEADKIFNKEGYNPLHLAVKMNKSEVTASILRQENFDKNTAMSNGETALHIAAQLGHSDILQKLIEQGGDLSVTDKEEGHTPLHDCLQQVYFEGATSKENFEKFQKVWDAVVEKAVIWWCQKQEQSEPANGSKEYLEIQRKAIYYLRSCIPNKNGLSVLQFAADRGLVTCVQNMLSAKDIFVRLSKADQTNSDIYEMDITNLCPEYFVKKSELYSEEELRQLESHQVNLTDDSRLSDNSQVLQQTGDNLHSKNSDNSQALQQTGDNLHSKNSDNSQVQQQIGDNLHSKNSDNSQVQQQTGDNLHSKNSDNSQALQQTGDNLHSENSDISQAQQQTGDNLHSRSSDMPETQLEVTSMKTEINSLLDALVEVRPPNKAGEILESIPMIKLTQLEWKISQRIIFGWGVMHILLMILITMVMENKEGSPKWYIDGSLIGVLYASIISSSHLIVKIIRFAGKKPKGQAQKFVKDSIKLYEKVQDDEGILKKVFEHTALIVELLFTILAWTVFFLKITLSGSVWAKGFFLLFGWLMLLIPMTSYGPVYKIISVLKYIIIRDMMPWIMIYITISIGFAMAIKLQFEELPGSSSCEDLAGFLNETGHTFFELVIMTSGLDTDLKQVRSLACLFEHHTQSAFVILFLITLYAIISAVVLLNMLIAIMSNTVTEAQNDKGWRQYQVSN